MGEITLKGYECERCQHQWVPREEGERPRVCPKCKSPYWDRPRQITRTTDLKELKKYR